MPHSTRADLTVPWTSADEDDILPDAQAIELASKNSSVNADPNGTSKQAPNVEVKFEELFNDDDEMDDVAFVDSEAATTKVESSPPAAPL